MLSFINFLLEKTNRKPKEVQDPKPKTYSDAIGKIHEREVHKGLDPTSVLSIKEEAKHAARIALVGDEYPNCVQRAKHAVAKIHEHIIKGRPFNVQRVSIGKKSQTDPSDLNIDFNDGKPETGISLKATIERKKDNRDISLSNPTSRPMNSIHGEETSRPPGVSNSQHLQNIASKIASAYNVSTPEKKIQYLKDVVFRTREKPIYIVHTIGDNPRTVVLNPNHFKETANDSSIYVKYPGKGNTMGFFRKNLNNKEEKVAKFRVKYKESKAELDTGIEGTLKGIGSVSIPMDQYKP